MTDTLVTFGEETADELLDLIDRKPTTADDISTPGPRGTDDRFQTLNSFVNNSGETIPAFALMLTDGLMIDGDRYYVEVIKPDGTNEKACLVNGPRAVPTGETGAFQDTSNTFALLTDETEGLVGPASDWKAESGQQFEVIGEIETGVALVVGQQTQSVKIGKADADIAIDTSGVVSIWRAGADTGEDVTAWLDWMHGDDQVSLGKEVLIQFFKDENIWRITGAECED